MRKGPVCSLSRSWRTAVSSTQRTSAVWLAARRRRGAQRTSPNCTTITWRLKLEWRCGVGWLQALSRAVAGMCLSGGNVTTSGRSSGTSCSARWRRNARCVDAGALPSSEPVAATTSDAIVVETVLACWTHRTDGTIHTSETDQASGWRPPALVKRNDDGGWDFDASGVLPAFDPERRNGATAQVDATEGDTDDDDDTPVIVTANGVYAYNSDWNDIEKSTRPTRAAATLMHRARQRTDTSRWWSMRWPSDAVSLLGRACDLNTGKTYELLRQLRELSVTHLRQLWGLSTEQLRLLLWHGRLPLARRGRVYV